MRDDTSKPRREPRGRRAQTRDDDLPAMLPPLSAEQLAEVELSREEALSHLTAGLASQDDEVRAFRTKPEHGLQPFLAWDAVDEWIERHRGSYAGAPGALFINDLPLPEGASEVFRGEVPREVLQTLPNIEIRPADLAQFQPAPRFLEYSTPDGPRQVEIQRLGSPLDHLRVLSERLADRYAWSTAQSTAFVLTGLVPRLSLVTATGQGFGRPEPALHRIVLTIDPALSPKEVAERYSAARGPHIGSRHRELGAKSLALALFAAMRPAGETWAERMTIWNDLHSRAHPDWTYNEVANFSHDCLVARRRLLGESAKPVRSTRKASTNGKARPE